MLLEVKIMGRFSVGSSYEVITCYGDSGGPLVSRATGLDLGFSLIGVHSWGDQCQQNTLMGAAEVSHFLPWIAKQYGLSLP